MSFVNAFESRSGSSDAALLARADRSSFLWGKPPAVAPSMVEMFDLRIENTTLDAAAESLVEAAKEGRRQRVAFLNAHVINSAAADSAYARVLDGADRLYADGSGMALAARMFGHRLVDNVNGTDLLPLLCAAAARAGQKIFLLGGKPGVALEAAMTLGRMGYGDVVAGTHHGYVKRGGAEESEAIAAVNESGASILLVGMGVPVQDVWIARNFEKLAPAVVLGVGGLFDFFAGSVSRAPAFLRSVGMEWTWRLAQEPSRMWRRYLVGNVTFLIRAFFEALGKRLSASSIPDALAARAALFQAATRTRLAAMIPPAAKRALDVAAASMALMLLGLPLLIVAMLIKLESPGPALFRQTRVGRNGKPFTMFKFRSMHINADAMHAALSGNSADPHLLRFKAKQDPRVTRIGRFIRKASIDELPQLWNVLKGDMSIVGPRPALPSEVARYSLADRDRLLVKPGITCTWQVNGRADIDFVGQVELDREYVKKFSILKDLLLMIRTIPAVLTARGAY
jgi:exopolysaccharide biosynthesis WecB/TagA/CpsF family protein